MPVLAVASFVLYMTYLVWAPSAAVVFVYRKLNFRPSRRAQFYWRILKWPALAGIVSFWAVGILEHVPLTPDVFFFALFFTYWMCFRNVGRDDNDDKKEQKRIRARIKQVGGRLVVVPETTTA